MNKARLVAGLLLAGALATVPVSALADSGWPQKVGGTGIDRASKVTLDASGNLYVIGQFNGTAVIGDSSLDSRGAGDVFVGKIDAGGVWQWVVQAGGTADDRGLDVAVDGSGGVYVTGTYQGSDARFGDVVLTSSGGGDDLFVAKLDANGTWTWANSANGPGTETGMGIAVNDAKQVFVAGQFSRQITFPANSQADFILKTFSENSVPPDTTSPDYDAFVAKLTPGGEWQWARQAGGTFPRPYTDLNTLVGADWCCQSNSLPFGVVDWTWNGSNWTNVYATGNVCTYNKSPYSSAPFPTNQAGCINFYGQAGLPNMYYWWISTWYAGSGQPDHAWYWDGSYRPPDPIPGGGNADTAAQRLWGRNVIQYDPRISNDAAVGIAVKRIPIGGDSLTPKNIIYLTGFFQQNLGVSNAPLQNTPPTPATIASAGAGKRDLFVAKLVEEEAGLLPDIGQPVVNPNPYWVWLKDGGNTDANDEIWANDITLDKDGYLYVAGGYTRRPSLAYGLLADTGTGRTGGFVARIADNDAYATWLWAKTAQGGGTGDAEYGSVAVDGASIGARGVYAAGTFTGTATLTGGKMLTAKGSSDVIVARHKAGDGTVAWATRGGLYAAEYLGRESGSVLVRGGIAADSTGTTFVTGSFDTATGLIPGETMALNGVDQSIYAPANVSETDYAVSLWIKTDSPGRGIFSVVNAVPPASSGHDRHLYLDNDGNLLARVWSNETITTSGNNLADGQWHHIVHTFGGVAGVQKLYVDGLERAAGSMTASAFSGQTGYAIGFSVDAAVDFFQGKIANVRISSSRTPAQIRDLFANDLPVESGGKILFSAGNRDAFVATLDPLGAWRESEEWTVGQIVPRPAGAYPFKPDFDFPADPDKCFYWSTSELELYATWRCGAVIRWRVSSQLSNADRIVTVGASDWPAQPQIHVAGVPVDLQPPSTNFFYTKIMRTEAGADDSIFNAAGTRVFRAAGSGYSVLMYGDGGPDLSVRPVAFEVIRTLPWDDTSILEDGAACTIGQRITDPSHTDPAGKNGYLIFEKAYYDGAGVDRSHDRATRSGPIIPVNRMGSFRQNTSSTAQNAGHDMVVAWYATNDKEIPWPVRPVRYDCRWPSSPRKIVIASQLGSDVYNQPPLDPTLYPEAQVYRQPDATLPGYNPNEEHASLFPSATGNGWDALFALRNDLNSTSLTSEAYSLLKYRKPSDGQWAMQVYRVEAVDTVNYKGFAFPGVAGTPIFPPYPVRLLNNCSNSFGQGDPYWQDSVNHQYWAKSAGTVTVRYYYPLLKGWDFAGNKVLPAQFTGNQGDCVAWLDRLPTSLGLPIPVVYNITWPADIPVLQIGETLLGPKRGLPDIMHQAATEVVFEGKEPTATHQPGSLVQLIEPLSTRWVSLAALPAAIKTKNVSGMEIFEDLAFHLQQRVVYDPMNNRLGFKGYFDDTVTGDPLLLLNVMSGKERDELLDMATDTAYANAVRLLFFKTRNPRDIDRNRNGVADQIPVGDPTLIGFQDYYTTTDAGVITAGGRPPNAVPDGKPEPLQALGAGHALTAGSAGGTGYVTLAFNNDPSLGSLPVSLKVVRVDCGPYLGEIKVIQSLNVFDEKLTLRHSGDFGGNPELFTFEWYYHPDENGVSPTPLPSPETSRLNGWLPFAAPNGGIGAVSIDIRGASLQTLSDNWFYVRYKGYSTCNNTTTFTPWAGAPGSTAINPSAMLAEGWIKRVVRSLNAFEARVKDFHSSATATYASMIEQAGERYEGDVAMNNDPDNLNSLGLIEAYETVLRRGMTLSIEGTPPIDYAPANAALLLAASRIADFYTLLGNEAYADATDPTIGFGTVAGDYGSQASSIFAFQNQLDSLLEEELVLLRGKDKKIASPIYNRLLWNFTTGDGEVAYSQVYGMSDRNESGVIDEFDARVMYPQGHGDGWGHYLTAMTTYYKLLRHPFYSWDPRAEAVNVAGSPVTVDYLDERKFATIAAAKSRAGAEIVDLTYRNRYVDDPAGQWQGYKDTDPARAWGLAEWGRRAGQGTYFDWVVANAILPSVDNDPDHVQEIQKIDRRTVLELAEIPSQFTSVQSQIDKADAGLSPLGLAKGVVPFDINPTVVDPAQGSYARTHFEQIYDRAVEAMSNAVSVFNNASEISQSLRRNQDSLDDFARNVSNQEEDYKNRLIEMFGYPYAGDIGPTGTYADGYDGPDLLHYMWVDSSELTGTAAPTIDYDTAGNAVSRTVSITFEHAYDESKKDEEDPLDKYDDELAKVWNIPGTVTYKIALDGTGIVKPANMGVRRSQGELQRALSEIHRARSSYQQALIRYDNAIADIKSKAGDLEMEDDLNLDELEMIGDKNSENLTYNVFIGIFGGASKALLRVGEVLDSVLESAAECGPKVNGFSNDFTSFLRCAFKLGGVTAKNVVDIIGDGLDIVKESLDLAKEDAEKSWELKIEKVKKAYELTGKFGDLEKLIREEPLARMEAFERKEALQGAIEQYAAVLANAQRTIDGLVRFRQQTAAEVQQYRYQDMTFRVFRNDAIQKYRAQYDLAARYVYLAAAAYDYETNLLGSSSAAGRRFLTDIVRQRALGQVQDGKPVAGTPGLADPLARMGLNFSVLKGQLGFNNPQTETNRFSLRSELFRIDSADDAWPDPLVNDLGNTSETLWSNALTARRVDDLWSVPEFRRYCRSFAPEDAGAQPGLVIPFATTVSWGLNWFGWPLGGGDSAYDPTNFATRVRSAGVWFGDYDLAGLANTPRVYLVPAGMDVLRSPNGTDWEFREWQVVDQKLPVPFAIGASDLTDPGWIPLNDSLSDVLGGVRKYSSFRAYHDAGDFDPAEMATDTRLVGRSVWNTKWLLIIPGATLHYEPDVGLNRFINAVSDIKVFFQTYGYSGN